MAIGGGSQFFAPGPASDPQYVFVRDDPDRAEQRAEIEESWDRFRPFCGDGEADYFVANINEPGLFRGLVSSVSAATDTVVSLFTVSVDAPPDDFNRRPFAPAVPGHGGGWIYVPAVR